MKNGLRKTNCLFLLGGLFIGAFLAYSALVSKPATAAAGINQTVNFQGRLLNSQGAAVPDGFYNIEFKIYQDGDGQTAGDTTGSPAGSLKWTEDWLNNNSQGVKVVNGYMSVQLGKVTPFGSNVDWNQDTLWLSMNVAGTGGSCATFAACSPDGEMLPMQPLTAAPYALNAGKLGGLSSTNFVQLAQGVQTDNTTASSIFINKTGASGNILQLQKSGADVLVLDNSGRLGIGGPAANGLVTIGTNTTANSGGIYFGTDTNLYRSGTSSLKTDSNFQVGSSLQFTNSGTILFGSSADVDLYRSAADTLKTDDSLVVAGNGLFQNSLNSATAFQIQNAAGSALFVGDTANSRVGIGLGTPTTNFQVSGNSLFQGYSNNSLTASGNEITDATRTAGTSGDGRTPPDSSYGIWEGTTNLLVNGGFETNTTGWAGSSGAETLSRDLTKTKFGSASLKAITPGVTNPEGVSSPSTAAGTAASGQTWTASAWVWAPSGATMSIQTVERDASNALLTSGSSNFTGTGSWQRVTYTRTLTNASTSRLNIKILTVTSNQAITFWTDGAQLEQKPNPTPYVETNGSTASRSISSVQGPASALNSTQGWVAMRVRTPWAPGDRSSMASNPPRLFGWGDNSNNQFQLWETSSYNGVLSFQRTGGSGGTVNSSSIAWTNAGDYMTVIAAWTATQTMISVNGGNFATLANTSIPTIANSSFKIGDLGYASLDAWDGDYMWFASGTGTLTNADAVVINSFGNIDPSFPSFPTASTPKLVWNGATTTANTPDSTLAFQVQNTAGTRILNVNTVSGIVEVGTASTQTGLLRLFNASGSGNITLQAANPSTNSYTITIPAETGTVCTTAAAGACSVAGSGYVQLAATSVQADSTTNNSIFINKTGASGNVLDLQKNGVDVLRVDNSGNLLLGKAGTGGQNGSLVFSTTNASNSTITVQAASTASSYTLTLPTAGPALGQCLQNDGTTLGQLTFGPCGANGTFLNKNATDTSSAAGGAGYLYGFTSTGSSTGGVLSLDNSTNTGNTFSATTAGNPAAGKAVIYGQNTNASPSGNLLDLEAGSSPTSKFSVAATGDVTAAGKYNTNTFTGSSLVFGSATAASVQSASSQALNITGNASSTWSVGGTNQNLTIQTSGTGTLAVDTAGGGTVNIGTGNAATVGIGNNSTTNITIGGTTSTGTIITRASGITQTITGSATAPSVVIKTTTDNSGAFQVQNNSSQRVLGVDTSAKQVVLGQSSAVNGSLLFQNSSNSHAITLNSTGANADYTLTLPAQAPSGGLCIQTSTGNAAQLVFASCANNNTSISQVAYWDANATNVITGVTPSTVGDVLVLTTQIPNAGVTVSGVAGGGVTTWNKVVANSGNGTVNRVELWVGTVTSLTTSNITVTYTGGTASGEEVTATEFTAAGVNQSTSWGIESSSSQLNSTASTTVTYPSLTAVNGAELYIGYAQVQNPPATSNGTTGFSYKQTNTQHNMVVYNPSLTANTAYQPTALQSSSGQSNTVAAVLTAFVTSTAINNSTSLQKANFYVQAANAGSVAGVLQAASSGSADIFNLRNSGGTNVVTVGSTGNVLVKPSASATAFQVQNGSGYSVMAVDTSGNSVVVGDATHLSGSITFKDSGDSNTISITAPTSIATNYSLALPTNAPTAGLCLATSPSNANQLVFSSCATQVSAATISYINKWDSHTGGPPYTISDSPTSVGNLLVLYSHVSGGATVSSVSGGGVASGGWTKVTAYTGAGTPGNIEMWRGVVATTGSGTITVSYTGTVGTYEIAAQEFSMGSANGTWAIDTSGTATTTSSVATVNYPTLTPLNSNELYAGYAYGGGTMTGTCSGTGFTFTATGFSKELAYDTSVTGGTPYTPTCTQSTGVYASIAALIEAYVGTSVIVNTTATQQANFNVQAAVSGSVAGVLQGATSGTADILQVKDSTGNNVMSVNSTSGVGTFGVTLGTPNVSSGQLIFNSSSNSNYITITAPSAPGSSYQLVLPTTTPAPGQCLATSPSNANQLVFSSCANQVTSVAISFVNSWKTSTGASPATLSVSPANLGDLMVLFVSFQKADSVSSGGVSGGGCGSAWSKVASTASGSGTDTTSIEMYRCQVTSTGTSNVSVTWSGPAGTHELAAMEFTTGNTTGSWVVDSSNTQLNSSSATTTWPSLTPQSSKDLYVGYAASSGSTYTGTVSSGFTAVSGSLTNREGLYNTSVSATTQPTGTTSGSAVSLTVGALIAAYSSSSVISNSTVTQVANFNIQAATPGSVAGVLQAFPTGSGDILELLDGNGTLVDSFDSAGNLLVRPSTAGATAFQVQTTGNVNVLSVDTSAAKVVIGAGSAGETSVSLLVLDNQTGNSADLATAVNGAMYYNATTHTFRCAAAGAWQNCSGLIYSNVSTPTVSNCSNNCSAFSTSAAIPANYCQTGRVINLHASGYFSSQVSASNLQFGVYYGSDGSVAANDTLIGSLPPTVSVSSASNNYFQLDFTANCFSTSSIVAEGKLSVQVGAAGAGLTSVPLNATSGTTVTTSGAQNLYIFPIWSVASASNTATITQFNVSSP